MKIRRTFNLSKIGHRYESVVIEMEGDDVLDLIQRIDRAWRAYAKAIQEGKVQ